MQKQPPKLSYKKAVVEKLADSDSQKKHLCWNLFLIQNIAKSLRTPIQFTVSHTNTSVFNI